ncbi:hypothetical protein [Tolypothrix sp. VBCCA 56010]|uniref:hypothetical protein n=1 Tax=Tolypothrix sp. VBCCA 56010 TaxID=3137731 RepID=UPI003D7D3EEF
MKRTNDTGVSKLYTFDELREKVELERCERLKNGVVNDDFRVYFQKSNLTIQIEENGKNFYEIDLEQCNNSDDLLDWIFHIHSKTWGQSGGLLAAILLVLKDACQEIHRESARTLFTPGQKIDWRNPKLLKR